MAPDTPPGTPQSPSMLPPKEGFGSVMRDAWRLASPYYLRSDERWSARLLLVTVIAMNFILVGINVQLNTWNGALYNSLQNKDYQGFVNLLLLGNKEADGFMIGFTPLAGAYILIAIYRTYLRQWLEIRWRRWFTERTLTAWMADRAYYTIGLQQGAAGTDNPDQRISEDLNSFTTDTVTLGLSLLSNIVSLVSFASILWALSGDGVIFGVTIPGYLLWVAVLYAVVGTGFTHLIGRPLAALEFQRQRVEADFRFGLVRVRENAEGVALYGGEQAETAALLGRFVNIVANVRATMTRVKKLTALNAGYSQVAGIFPLIVVAPRYFAGTIALGGMMRVVGAFSEVQGALSWFVDAYPQLAKWRATVGRLTGFQQAIEDAKRLAQGGVRVAPAAGPGLSLEGVTLALPDGRTLLEGAALGVPRGRSTVVSGRSGSGKSTLFRAIAGIWPFGGGTVRRPAEATLFLPQKPYIPLGTLRRAVSYPAAIDAYPQAEVEAALTDAGLAKLIPELDVDMAWAQRLSGGEQQRLALARALLTRPDWLFLDEATASMDPQGAAELYAKLRERLPNTTLLSIAHHPEVAKLHEGQLILHRGLGSGILSVEAAE